MAVTIRRRDYPVRPQRRHWRTSGHT